jgi:hypothetical protein
MKWKQTKVRKRKGRKKLGRVKRNKLKNRRRIQGVAEGEGEAKSEG